MVASITDNDVVKKLNCDLRFLLVFLSGNSLYAIGDLALFHFSKIVSPPNKPIWVNRHEIISYKIEQKDQGIVAIWSDRRGLVNTRLPVTKGKNNCGNIGCMERSLNVPSLHFYPKVIYM